jgi:hypothetical protein
MQRQNLGDIHIHSKIILKLILKVNSMKDIDLIHCVCNSPHQILLKTVMNFQILYKVRNFISTVVSKTAISKCFNAIITPRNLPGKASFGEPTVRSPGHALVCKN